MHGPAVDELRVLLDGKTVLSIVGEKGDRWMTAQVQINASNSEVWKGFVKTSIFSSSQCPK